MLNISDDSKENRIEGDLDGICLDDTDLMTQVKDIARDNIDLVNEMLRGFTKGVK